MTVCLCYESKHMLPASSTIYSSNHHKYSKFVVSSLRYHQNVQSLAVYYPAYIWNPAGQSVSSSLVQACRRKSVIIAFENPSILSNLCVYSFLFTQVNNNKTQGMALRIQQIHQRPVHVYWILYMCMRKRIHMHMYMYMIRGINMDMCMDMCIYMFMYVYMYLYRYMYMCICICVCVYMYMYPYACV